MFLVIFRMILQILCCRSHSVEFNNNNNNNIFFIIIGIQPLGRFGQRPELSQATGMALVRCILGEFLGVVCYCFPPLLDVSTFATRCLHVRHNARDPSGRRWNFAEMTTSTPFRDLPLAANLRYENKGLTSPAEDVFALDVFGRV